MNPDHFSDEVLTRCAVDAIKWVDRQYKVAKQLGFKGLKTVIEPTFEGYRFALVELYGCTTNSDIEIKEALERALTIVGGAVDAEI